MLVRRVQIQSEAHCVIQMEHLECLTRRQDRPVAAHWRRVSRIPTIVTTLHLSTQYSATKYIKHKSCTATCLSFSFSIAKLHYGFVCDPKSKLSICFVLVLFTYFIIYVTMLHNIVLFLINIYEFVRDNFDIFER